MDMPDSSPFTIEAYCNIHNRSFEPVEPSGPWVGIDQIMGACPECRERRRKKRDLDAASSARSLNDGTVLLYSELLDYMPPCEDNEHIKMQMRSGYMRSWGDVAIRPVPPNLPPYYGPGQWNHNPYPEEIEFDASKRQKTLEERGIDFWDIGTFRPVDDGQVQIEVCEHAEDLYLATGGECETLVITELYLAKSVVQYGTLNQFPQNKEAQLYCAAWIDRRDAWRLVSIRPASRVRYNSQRDAVANLLRRMGIDEEE